MPRIYYLHPRHAVSPPDWSLHAANAARLGFDHLCAGPIFAPAGGDPFLISDLGTTDPGLGIAGSPEKAVREIASLCNASGLRLFLDVVLDRLAADGPSAREARGLYESHDRGGVVDPREDPAARATATLRTNAIDRLVPWWTER